jgi:serine/threonine protein kinase
MHGLGYPLVPLCDSHLIAKPVHVALLISRFVLDLAKQYGTRGLGSFVCNPARRGKPRWRVIIPNPDVSLTAGVRLGPYQIVAPIGSGGMGEVYRATDTRLDRAVAIKVLPTHLSTTPELRQRSA